MRARWAVGSPGKAAGAAAALVGAALLIWSLAGGGAGAPGGGTAAGSAAAGPAPAATEGRTLARGLGAPAARTLSPTTVSPRTPVVAGDKEWLEDVGPPPPRKRTQRFYRALYDGILAAEPERFWPAVAEAAGKSTEEAVGALQSAWTADPARASGVFLQVLGGAGTSPDIRRFASRFLASRSQEQPVARATLIEAVASGLGDAGARTEALVAVVTLGTEEEVSRCGGILLSESDPDLVAAAAIALRGRKSRPSDDWLTTLRTAHPVEAVRRRIEEALAPEAAGQGPADRERG